MTGGDYAGEAAAAVAVTVLEADTARADLTLEFGPPTHTDPDSNGEVTLGDGLSYEASARNSGNVPLSNVTVSDERAGGAAKMCATLGIGESCEWSGSYQVTQADVDAGKVDNTVTATADEVTDQQANQSTPVAQERELTLEKTAHGGELRRSGREHRLHVRGEQQRDGDAGGHGDDRGRQDRERDHVRCGTGGWTGAWGHGDVHGQLHDGAGGRGRVGGGEQGDGDAGWGAIERGDRAGDVDLDAGRPTDGGAGCRGRVCCGNGGEPEVQREVERGERADGDGGVRDGGRDGDGGQRLHGGGGPTAC